MGEPVIRTIVEAIHSSPTQAVVYLSGGASVALGWLMSVPGASNTLLEAVVPYSMISMTQLLGKKPKPYCSQATANDMALLAYNRALRLSKPGLPVIGVGFTGTLATSRPKFGDHRFHLSMRASDRIWETSVTLTKNLRSREEEDNVASRVLIQAMAKACQVSGTLDSRLTESEVPDESETHFSEDEELEQVISGKVCFKIYPFSKEEGHGLDKDRKIILSGSFNPLHDGHLKLLEAAMSVGSKGGYPCFELSVANADKLTLSVEEIKKRVKHFEEAGKTVIVSNEPYFYKKAELFPDSSFVIGADTAARLVNPKYYGESEERMLEILSDCQKTGCIFLVGGREVDGVFKVLEDLKIPEKIRGMFVSIPEEKFRMNISSTELRKKQGGC